MSLDGRTKRSPLSGRYLVRNRGWNAALHVTDAVLSLVAQAKRAVATDAPARILVAVGGHLGDAVIATSALPVLARAYPNASIGMLLPSWSRVVVEGHPRLRWIHHADHWKTSRAGDGVAEKWAAYRSSALRAVDEISGVGYDLAIDLYAYYPNAAWLLWRAGVPIRIGYTSGGCGPLYTHALSWNPDTGHTAAQHARLIGALTETDVVGELAYDLPPIPERARLRAATLCRSDRHSDYIVIHPGTGDPKKAWPAGQWNELISSLGASKTIVLTGAGKLEHDLAATLARGRSNVVNLVDQLDWPTFRAVLASASVAIGPDSVAMHAAAAEGTPAVAIMAAMSDPEYWRPLGRRVAALTRQVPCAPCFQKNGCETMACVRDVTVDDVLDACERLGALDRPPAALQMPVV
ncbi:MAG: ADP-heptose:LPS heptosyltransferase [Gemmatimonadetes bacterium]|nr:ADP-heptose:LPS heptosyltransferase [Gemmatimonadota bacterium]